MPPPTRYPYLPATASWDFLAADQCDKDMNATPLGLCVECWFQLTHYLENECPTPQPEKLLMLRQQLTFLLNRRLPHLIPDLRRYRLNINASETPSVG